jgi:hypothetical protein
VSPRPAGRRSATDGPPTTGLPADAGLVPPERDRLDRSQVPGLLRVSPPLGRGAVERDPVPSHGARTGTDRYGERTRQAAGNAAIALVATIVVGQLWGLMVALDAWLGGDTRAVGWIVVFQAASFAVCLAVWLTTNRRSR